MKSQCASVPECAVSVPAQWLRCSVPVCRRVYNAAHWHTRTPWRADIGNIQCAAAHWRRVLA